jgi:excisionase family DNA binding protein
MDEQLWTPQEVADKLRVDLETVRRWLRLGELEGIKFGRQWRIENKAFEAFYEDRKKKSKPS